MKKLAIVVTVAVLSLCITSCTSGSSDTEAPELTSDREEIVEKSEPTKTEKADDTQKKDVENEVKIETSKTEPLPSYQDMVAEIESSIGIKYSISGRVTQVSGGSRGSDYYVYVYWDNSETQGEVASVRIPYKSYSKSVNKRFSGVCTLEGLDERGHPQFVCTSYSAK